MRAAAELIKKEAKTARIRKEPHPFESFDLSRLRTHSMKKTAVSLLKEQRFSSAIVASLTGTSARTLETVYDRPTDKRTRKAVNKALGPIVKVFRPSNDEVAADDDDEEEEEDNHDDNFCTHCGHALLEAKQRYCSKCGHKVIRRQ